MKLALIALTLLASAQAQAGYFACTDEYGVITAGEVDSEANITGLRIIQAGNAQAADIKLEVEEANFANTFYLRSRQAISEGSITYTIQADTENGTSPANFTAYAGTSIIRSKGFCTVGFERNESEGE